MLLLCCLVFPAPAVADPQSDWLGWKEKGLQEQASESYRNAVKYYDRSVSEAEKIGPHSIQCIESKARLATCLVYLHEFTLAEPYFNYLMREIEQHRKDKSLDGEMLVWLEDVAEAYERAGLKTNTKKRFGLEHALALRDLISGDENPEMAWTLKEMAKLYMQAGQMRKALPLGARLVAIHQKYQGHQSLALADDFVGMAMLESELGKQDDAESYIRQALVIFVRDYPKHGTLQLYNARLALGRILIRKKEYDLGEKEAREALAEWEKVEGKDSQMTVLGRQVIASAKMRTEHFAEAAQLYRQNVTVLEKALGPNHQRLIGQYQRLQNAYKGMKSTAGVKETEAKIKAIEAANPLPHRPSRSASD